MIGIFFAVKKNGTRERILKYCLESCTICNWKYQRLFFVKVVKNMQLFFFVQFLRILLITVKCDCLSFQSSIIVSWKDLIGGMSRVWSGFIRSHLSNKNSKRNHLHYVKLFTWIIIAFERISQFWEDAKIKKPSFSFHFVS